MFSKTRKGRKWKVISQNVWSQKKKKKKKKTQSNLSSNTRKGIKGKVKCKILIYVLQNKGRKGKVTEIKCKSVWKY